MPMETNSQQIPHTTEAAMPEPPIGSYRRARRYIYELVESPEVETRLEQYIRIGIGALIVLNVLAVIIGSVKEVQQGYGHLLLWLEYFSVAIFSVEYLLRIWSVVEEPGYERLVVGRLRYMVSFFALVDLLAILPFFLPRLTNLDLRFVRALRLMRLVRILKLGRYSKTVAVFGRVFMAKKQELLVSLFAMVLLLIVASTVIFYTEHEAQPDVFPNIPASLWWGIVTLTTIGYGDVYPITAAGKFCAAIIAVLSVGLVALPSGIIVTGFVEELAEKERKMITCPHCNGEFDVNAKHGHSD